MDLAQTIAACRRAVAAARAAGHAVRLVPTMGALHDGHLALLRAARADGGFVVATLFVNPAQFDQATDLARYPRTFDADRAACAAAGVDLLFAPSDAEMYPAGWAAGVVGRTAVRVQGLSDVLCGQYRPGHFDGVCGVVAKLFHIAQPDVAYFGQKDYQQAAIIQQMVRDLDFPLELRVCPTVREADGLAMSSRNVRLTPAGRAVAPVLYRALQAVQGAVAGGARDAAAALAAGRAVLAAEPAIRVEYLELRDAASLEAPAGPLPAHGRWVVAIAAYVDAVRLIDNVVVQR